MKKLKLNAAKLQLAKEKIANLSIDQAELIHGGASGTIVIVKPTTETGPVFSAGCTDAGCTATCPQSAATPCLLTVMCTFHC